MLQKFLVFRKAYHVYAGGLVSSDTLKSYIENGNKSVFKNKLEFPI